MNVRCVEVLPHVRTARFDRQLTYRVPADLQLDVGDIVRVPLGPREGYAYVLVAPCLQPWFLEETGPTSL